MNISNSFAALIRKYLLGFETKEEYHTLKDAFDELSSLQLPAEDIIQGGQNGSASAYRGILHLSR